MTITSSLRFLHILGGSGLLCARAHRHTTEQLVGRGSAQKKSYYTITNADDELVKPIIDVAA